MAVHVDNVVFTDWQALNLPGGWSDTFIFPVSYRAGLPPGDYAQAIQRLSTPLARLRRSASLWIQPDAPGRWFAEELRQRLRGLMLPVAVTQQSPSLRDFSFSPWTDRQLSPPPPTAPPLFQTNLTDNEIGCLRVLARLQQGYTSEIAALTGISPPTAREALQGLAAQEFAVYISETDEAWRFPRWSIRRIGASLALRSWGLPAGISFEGRKERGITQARARRTARVWPAWVRHAWRRHAWPGTHLWAGWSEVNLGNPYPDALVWGMVNGFESLVWLEVERGNQMTRTNQETLQSKLTTRFNRALVYVRRFSTGPGTRLRLVFAVLGPERVQQVARTVFHTLPGDAAVVIADWKAFGDLPEPVWGNAR